MERTCFRFVLTFLFFPLSTSFVFIIEISYILSYLMLQDKCLCCSVIYYTQHESRIWEFENFPCDICSCFRFSWKSTRHKHHVQLNVGWGKKKKSLQTFSRAFLSLTHATTFPIGSTISSRRSLQHTTENVMNENVFYVTLHNIIVFNKQISLSLHLIVNRTSQNLSSSLMLCRRHKKKESRIICLL